MAAWDWEVDHLDRPTGVRRLTIGLAGEAVLQSELDSIAERGGFARVRAVNTPVPAWVSTHPAVSPNPPKGVRRG